LHPIGRLLFEAMDKGKDLSGSAARQALAYHDLEPSLLSGDGVRGLDVAAVDPNGPKRVALRQAERIEGWSGIDAFVRLPIEALTDVADVSLPRRDARDGFQR
jgi:hypothetical protein